LDLNIILTKCVSPRVWQNLVLVNLKNRDYPKMLDLEMDSSFF